MTQMFGTTSWSGLDTMRVGKWGEQFVAMALIRNGYDVYLPTVDDRAIDLIVRIGENATYVEMQVKTVRLARPSYVIMRKKHFTITRSRYLAMVVLHEDNPEPEIYFIPSKTWLTPQAPFSSRDYANRASDPEFGLSVSRKILTQLQDFRFSGGPLFGELRNSVDIGPVRYPTTESESARADEQTKIRV